jgi:hypothetical protein
MLRLAPACLLFLIVAPVPLFAAAPAATPVVPATQPLARRLADAKAKVKAAVVAMEAAKVDAMRRYDAGKGHAFVLDLGAKAATADIADALGPQARINALSAFLRAKSDMEWRHAKAIDDDAGVAAATQAVAAAQAEREAIRREVDSMAMRD